MERKKLSPIKVKKGFLPFIIHIAKDINIYLYIILFNPITDSANGGIEKKNENFSK